MVDTHCLPNGVLGTSELPVPQISLATMSQMVPAGAKRGVVVWLHGIFPSAQPVPVPLVNGLANAIGTLTGLLVADGWVVLQPIHQEDLAHPVTFPASPSYGIQLDIGSDSGHGTRYVASAGNTFDHIIAWIHANYGVWPIVPFGVSWGGWHALQYAVARTSQIIAYGAHCSVTNLQDLNTGFTTPANWTTINTSGANILSAFLDSMTGLPGWLGWSTNDVAVGDTDIIALKNAAITAGCPITTLADTTNNHGLYATDIGPGGTGFTGTTIMDWFTGTVDPLAPAVH